MKIVLITIDTLRADRVGCYGYTRDTTPNIDRLASEGAVFRHVFSPSTYTIPSHAAVLTGRYPGGLSVFFAQREGSLDKDRDLMLQELLSGRGYETAAFVGSLVLKKAWGLDSGFGLYDDTATTTEGNRPEELIRPGDETNKRLFEWLGENWDKDFFTWVHYFDVHGPYHNPEPFASLFRPEDYGPEPLLLNAVREGEPGGIPNYQLMDVVRDDDGALRGYERDARRYFAQYDAGVRVVDHAIGSLVEELKRLGIYDDTALVVTSDHGEAMGENGIYFFHGLTTTPDQVKVPLIMKLPGGARAGYVGVGPASTVDIAPTILEMAGIDSSRLGLDGVRLFDEKPDSGRFILSENEWQRAVIRGGLFMAREKDIARDGFTYYYDSKDLCKGVRLYDSRTGLEVGDGARESGELWEFSEILRKNVDPREATIRAGSILCARLQIEKYRAIGERNELAIDKQQLLAEKENLLNDKASLLGRIDNLNRDLDAARLANAQYEDEIESMVNSKSWKLTYPLRWMSARLKGTR